MDSYKITIETFDKVALAYQEKFMKLDLYDDTYDTFCTLVERPAAKVLEIGCGPGNITKYILSKRTDFIVEAIDLAPNMVKLAKENNPTANCHIMDAREINKLSGRFDGVVCGFCMPYLSKEECLKLIKDSFFLLNNDGILYFSIIEDGYHKSGYETGSNGQDKVYVYYHQQDYLEAGLTENNFKLVDLKRRSYQRTDGTISTHMIFIARKVNKS